MGSPLVHQWAPSYLPPGRTPTTADRPGEGEPNTDPGGTPPQATRGGGQGARPSPPRRGEPTRQKPPKPKPGPPRKPLGPTREGTHRAQSPPGRNTGEASPQQNPGHSRRQVYDGGATCTQRPHKSARKGVARCAYGPVFLLKQMLTVESNTDSNLPTSLRAPFMPLSLARSPRSG